MTKTLLTQMGIARYDEIVAGWLDGTLQKKWSELQKFNPDRVLTKKEQVEERQIRAIAFMFAERDNPRADELLKVIRERKWRLIKFYKDGFENVEDFMIASFPITGNNYPAMARGMAINCAWSLSLFSNPQDVFNAAVNLVNKKPGSFASLKEAIDWRDKE